MGKVLYKKIAEDLMSQIEDNTSLLSTNGRFPKVREIEKKYNCSIYTAHKALKLLKESGIIETTQGKDIQLCTQTATSKNNGKILLILQNWRQLKEKSFAAEIVLGATTTAGSLGYSINIFNYTDWMVHRQVGSEHKQLIEMLENSEYSGVLWANPSDYDLSYVFAAEKNNQKLVTTNRSFANLQAPWIRDDLTASFEKLGVKLSAQGVKKLGVLSHNFFDYTFMQALDKLIKIMKKYGITVANEDILYTNRIVGNISYIDIIFQGFIADSFSRVDGYFLFMPNHLANFRNCCEKLFNKQPVIAVHSIKTVDTSLADYVIESDLIKIGSIATETLINHISNKRIKSITEVPANFIVN